MGGLKKRRSRPRDPATSPTTPGASTEPRFFNRKLEYEDDDIQRMPIPNSITAARSAKRLADKLRGGSGRTSTNLAGTRPYIASAMGNTQ